MTNYGTVAGRIAAGTLGAAAIALTLPTLAAAAPTSDADLAKGVGCAYAAQIAQHAAGAGGVGYSSKVINERNGLYLVECKVNVMRPGTSSITTDNQDPPLIYRVTVDANNRFFVSNAVGPNVPSVRNPGAPRAV